MSEAVRGSPGSETIAWHAIAADQVIGRLKTDPATGLDAAEASRRLSQYGPNRLPEGKQRGQLMRFLAQLNNVLVYVLLAAAFVKLMVGLWLDAAVILGVVIINALLGFFQEGKSGKSTGFNPQHAFGRGQDYPPPRDPLDPGRGTRARRCRAA